MKKKLIVLLTSLLLISGLCGCSNEKATITTTTYAVKYLVEQLAGDRVNVEYISSDDFIQVANIVDDYDEILSRTNLFLYVGELEPYLDVYQDFLTRYDCEIINLALLSAVNKFERYKVVYADDVKVVKQLPYYEGEEFESIDEYEKDPFIWITPTGMCSMALTIKEWLQSYYSGEALVIENNYKTLYSSLIRMDAEYQELNKRSDVKLVTVTASFGNWQNCYGVEVYPLILSKYGSLPTDDQLTIIEKSIKDNKVKYIVYDETLPEEMQELYAKVKKDLNLTEIKLSSLTKLSDKQIEENKDYVTVMYDNLDELLATFK